MTTVVGHVTLELKKARERYGIIHLLGKKHLKIADCLSKRRNGGESGTFSPSRFSPGLSHPFAYA